jgi:non-heme chloroperoxidase
MELILKMDPMQFVTTADQTKLYVKDWGTGRPIILIHGWPLSSDSWDDLAMAIADAGYRAIAYDRRGFGRSSQPWSGYDYDTLSDDLAAVLEQTNSQDAALIGFSMGGGEVARYMSRHECKRVSQAGLISSILPYRLKTPDNPAGTEQAAFDQTTLSIMQDRPAFLAGFFRNFFGVSEQWQEVSTERLQWAQGLSLQASLKATLSCVSSFATTDFRPDLHAFTVPTLIIHGTQDKIVPIQASSRLAAQSIAESMLIEYEGAPHGLFATDKNRLTQDLLNFLRC